jgi:hypothetical protein
MKEKQVNDILNLGPIDIEPDNKVLPTTYRPSLESADEINTDARYVRQNMYDLIEKGHGAIDELAAIADQSQHPRSYEVLATLIKTMGDLNKDLLDMHEKKKKLQSGEVEKPESKTVNNNLFVGSTSELLKMMNKND